MSVPIMSRISGTSSTGMLSGSVWPISERLRLPWNHQFISAHKV
jgi:hypothetical protein